MSERTAVYCSYGVGDLLLYVGITINPEARLRAHDLKKPCCQEVVSAGSPGVLTVNRRYELKRLPSVTS